MIDDAAQARARYLAGTLEPIVELAYKALEHARAGELRTCQADLERLARAAGSMAKAMRSLEELAQLSKRP